MSKFASGKNAYAVSDRWGQRYRYTHMRREWNGLLVGRDECEAKHPQLGPFKITSDPQALRDARPDRTEPVVQQLLTKNAFLSGSAGTAVITVTETNHGRTTGDTVRFRKANGWFFFSGFGKQFWIFNHGQQHCYLYFHGKLRHGHRGW